MLCETRQLLQTHKYPLAALSNQPLPYPSPPPPLPTPRPNISHALPTRILISYLVQNPTNHLSTLRTQLDIFHDQHNEGLACDGKGQEVDDILTSFTSCYCTTYSFFLEIKYQSP